MLEYICSVQGCPFGTDYEDVLIKHLSIPHDGPFCPCPIPDCEEFFKDYRSASAHFRRCHDYNTRSCFYSIIIHQGFLCTNPIFVCPICQHDVGTPFGSLAEITRVRGHCQQHEYQQLLQASEALLNAWFFSFGSKAYIYLPKLKGLVPSKEVLLALMILSDINPREVCDRADLKLMGSKLRTSLELDKMGDGIDWDETC